jgi:hypothetical protein
MGWPLYAAKGMVRRMALVDKNMPVWIRFLYPAELEESRIDNGVLF